MTTNPLKRYEITPTKRQSLLRPYREAIEAALEECEKPHVGGRRHMREPLSHDEQEHHDAVTRLLRGRAR